MGEAIGQSLSPAVGVALSPIPIVAVIFLAQLPPRRLTENDADQVFLDIPFTNLITARAARSPITFSMTIWGNE
jgi:hypothetical protein